MRTANLLALPVEPVGRRLKAYDRWIHTISYHIQQQKKYKKPLRKILPEAPSITTKNVFSRQPDIKQQRKKVLR